MTERYEYDAIVVGSGPNGLAAAITLARAGCSVIICEARETVGGGTRSAELTLPGFVHDVCSAVHPLGVGSPFFLRLPLTNFGLKWVHPPAPLAHPLDDGSAVMMERSITATTRNLHADAAAYADLMSPLAANWHRLSEDILGPLPLPPRHPWLLTRFGLSAIRSARGLAYRAFQGERARALFAGLAGHSMLALDQPLSAAFGLVLGILGHAVGWPVARGGSQQIANALTSYLQSLGGQVVTGKRVQSLDELPPARMVLLDLTPRQILQIAGERLPGIYRCQLERYRYNPGVFKLDLALDGPIPWRATECRRAGTVHVGGTFEEVAAAERAVCRGQHPNRPFVLLAQQSLFDDTRAPKGKHTAWAYCHVPNGSTRDMTDAIERQIERFAPGFRERILASHAIPAPEMETYNANYVGGDINGGAQDLRQLYVRPAWRWDPYTTPAKGLYICSSATPPGGGVHGMCGYHAAQSALKRM